jgi:hypothetical protein
MGLFGKQSKPREKVPNIDFGQTSFFELQNELSHRSPNAQPCSAETEEIRPLFSKLFQDGGANFEDGQRDISSDGTFVTTIASESSFYEEKPRKRAFEIGSRSSSNTASNAQDTAREPSHNARVSAPAALTWSEIRRNKSDHALRVESPSLSSGSIRDVDFQTTRSTSQNELSRAPLPSPQPNAFLGASRKDSLSQVLSPVSPNKIESPKPLLSKNFIDDDSRKGLNALQSPSEQKAVGGMQTSAQRVPVLQRTNSIARVAQRASLKRIHSTMRPRSNSETSVAHSPKSEASASPKRDVRETENARSGNLEEFHQLNSPSKFSSLLAATFTRRPSMRGKVSTPMRSTVESRSNSTSTDVLRVSTSQQKSELRGPPATPGPADEAERTAIGVGSSS